MGPSPDIPVPDIAGSLEDQPGRNTESRLGTRRKFLLPLLSLILVVTICGISIFALGRKGFSEWTTWQEASQNQEDLLLLPPQGQESLSPKPQITQTSSLWSASGVCALFGLGVYFFADSLASIVIAIFAAGWATALLLFLRTPSHD
jgi:hypothetical protein